jgi:hypothetical protein
MEGRHAVKSNDRNLALIISGVAVASIGIFMIARQSPLSPKDHDDRANDSPASSPALNGADWNGALPIATASGEAPTPTTLTSANTPPFDSAHPPPLSAIPAPIVPLPMDDSVSEKQRARDIQMLSDQVTLLEHQATLVEANGDAPGAAAIRVREARMRARIATLQDATTP